MHRINDKIIVHTEKVEGSVHVDNLTNEQLEYLTTWIESDKLIYKTPRIKLESICASMLVYLKRPAANSNEAQDRFIKEPFIIIKNKDNDSKRTTEDQKKIQVSTV